MILFLSEREWELGKDRARGREYLMQVSCPVQSLMGGSISWPWMRSWPESKSRVRCLPDWATQAPLYFSDLNGNDYMIFAVPLFHFLTHCKCLDNFLIYFKFLEECIIQIYKNQTGRREREKETLTERGNESKGNKCPSCL